MGPLSARLALGGGEPQYVTVAEVAQAVPGQAVPGQAILGQAILGQAILGQAIAQGEALRAALPEDLVDGLDQEGRPDNGFARRLGKALGRRSDITFPCGLTIRRGRKEKPAVAWVVAGEFGEFSGDQSGGRFGCAEDKDMAVGPRKNSPNSQNSPGAISGWGIWTRRATRRCGGVCPRRKRLRTE